jgi:hypothetical protein
MQNAAYGGIAIEPEHRNDAYRSVGSPEISANVFVLDDVTPPYVRAIAALKACDANLAIALCSLLDAKAPTHGNCGYAGGASALSTING